MIRSKQTNSDRSEQASIRVNMGRLEASMNEVAYRRVRFGVVGDAVEQSPRHRTFFSARIAALIWNGT